MNYWVLILFIFTFGCVKDESNVSAPSGSQSGTTSGGSSGGSGGTTDDPLAIHAWHLNNTGQKSFASFPGRSGYDINLKPVHETLKIRGKGVTIAVSDTGVDIDHPDLSGNALNSQHRNYASNSSADWYITSPLPSDGQSHGTGVTGLVSAIGWNGIGSRGVAPDSKFAVFRYIYSPSSSDTTGSRLAKKLDQLNGDFDIFNFSYGPSDTVFMEEDPEAFDALKVGATLGREGKGSIYVQAAGNGFMGNYQVCTPLSDPNCVVNVAANTNAHETLATPYKLVVGAVNADGYSASYSTPGSSIWISAPGGEFGTTEPAMITTDLQGCNAGASYRNQNKMELFNFGFHALNPLCDYMSTFNGTSSAAPVTSGVVALMLEANPDLTWRDVKHILATSADIIDYDPILNTLYHPWGNNLGGYTYDYKWVRNKANIWFSNWFGFGLIDADEAVRKALTYDPAELGVFEQTLNANGTWPYTSGELVGRTITDESSFPQEEKIWVGHNYIIEAVQIKITTDHPSPGELAVHLVSPSGTESRLLNINSFMEGSSLEPDTTMLSNAFYGERSEGFWTLKVYDGSSKDGTGDLINWKILISGHRHPYELSLPYPVTGVALATPGSQSLASSPVFSFANSASHGTVITYQAAVGETFEDENAKGWTSIGLNNYGHRLDGMSLIYGQTYYLKIRAVNPFGFSSIQVKPFIAGSL